MQKEQNNNFLVNNGVFVSVEAQKKFANFEKNYLTIREKESRILSIEEVKRLPYPQKNSPDYNLWQIRQKNIHRFLVYLSDKKYPLRILDIGCGNGFFTHMISKPNNMAVGVDINLLELKQATEAFPSKNITWYYADILNEKLPEQSFDIITFCASFQYFDNPITLLEVCQTLLNPDGEIHIIDSPFYTEIDKQSARKRSLDYFKSMQVESMYDYYHHHAITIFNPYNYQFKYRPRKFLNKFLRQKDSPFPWIIIK